MIDRLQFYWLKRQKAKLLFELKYSTSSSPSQGTSRRPTASTTTHCRNNLPQLHLKRIIFCNQIWLEYPFCIKWHQRQRHRQWLRIAIELSDSITATIVLSWTGGRCYKTFFGRNIQEIPKSKKLEITFVLIPELKQ